MKVQALASLHNSKGYQKKGTEFVVSATEGQDLITRGLAKEVKEEPKAKPEKE